MGITNPRPAMRGKESRLIQKRLQLLDLGMAFGAIKSLKTERQIDKALAELRARAAPQPPHHSHKFLSAYPDSFAA